MINKSNYEAFALDYLEGNLSVAKQQEMDVFLQNHPIIAAEIAELKEMVILVPDETIQFDNKAALLKTEGGARIIAMHKRNWFRAVVAAAAILILIGGYFAGYFSQKFEGEKVEYVNGEKTPQIQNNDIKEEAIIAHEEIIKKEESTPNPKMIKEEPIPQPRPKTIINENVANNTALKPKTPEQIPITNNGEEIQNDQDDSNMAFEETLQPMPTPLPEKINPIKLLPKQGITIVALPRNEIQLPPVTPAIQLDENTGDIADNTEINTPETQNPTPNKRQKALRKIGRFLGNLPFEEATASFIPTYYRDESK